MGKFALSPAAAAIVAALALAGCAGGSGSSGGWFGGSSQPQPEPTAQPLPAPDIPATIRAAEVVGRWGYAAYHRPEDRARTEGNARGQCKQAVVINQGPNGGLMMYLADQPELVELKLKGSQGGRNYIGPAEDPAGGPQDREIVSFDGRVMVMRFANPEIDGRYGTGIYVRCGPAAGGVAQKSKKRK